jgi:hypothetical protein
MVDSQICSPVLLQLNPLQDEDRLQEAKRGEASKELENIHHIWYNL